MFNLSICKKQECANPVLCMFEGAGAGPDSFGDYCYLHAPDQDKASALAQEYIRSHDQIVGMNLSYMAFAGLALEGKRFYGCTFRKCSFKNISCKNLRARMCVFDFSAFADCGFEKVNIQSSSFAGAEFSRVKFLSSELVNNNFCGISAVNTLFEDSDLYNSRFVRARLVDSALTNCNLQRTFFYESVRENVGMRLSSTRGAVFDETERIE